MRKHVLIVLSSFVSSLRDYVFNLCMFFFLFSFYSGKEGPLPEYERRIASGELLDGDKCQVVKTDIGLDFSF